MSKCSLIELLTLGLPKRRLLPSLTRKFTNLQNEFANVLSFSFLVSSFASSLLKSVGPFLASESK